MSENPRVSLHSVSVVVTAQFHNPSILNPDFLASREIVPADWKVAETLTTPPVSVVKYENGVEWSVDQSRLTVAEQSGPGFGDSSFRSSQRTATQVKTDPLTLPLQRWSAGSSMRRSSRLSGSPAVSTAPLPIQPHDWLAGSPLPRSTRRSPTSCR